MQSNASKNIIYSIVLLLLVAIVYLYRQNQQQPEVKVEEVGSGKVTFSGNTMGTSYRIVYLDPNERDFKKEIDSLLAVFNNSLSTYIEDSEISRFNRQDTLQFESAYFYPILKSSDKVYNETQGAFDPTVGPLVNLWGFGPGGPQLKDSVNIEKMLPLVNFKAVSYDSLEVRKKEGMYLDFSAIAKGYGVDVIADFLSSQGIEDMLVEIGGELVAKGVNDKGELWKVGINRPEELGRADQLVSIIALDNKALATSGNYRNFYEADGMKISHTIDPATGRPVKHGLLSATVIANDCMAADAYATAMMVMGTEKSVAFQKSLNDIEIFLIYNNEDGELDFYASEGIKPYLSFIEE
jgi:thiamine biosynthesis lipoprotein